MICKDNAFKDINEIKAHELKLDQSETQQNGVSAKEPSTVLQRRKGALDQMVGDGKKRGR